MALRHILVTSTAAFALAVGAAALAEQPKTPLVSGDEPMNVGASAQVKAPEPTATMQEKTQEMLTKEAGGISGDTNPVDEGDAAQMKPVKPNLKAQEATEKALKKEESESGAISGKYD